MHEIQNIKNIQFKHYTSIIEVYFIIFMYSFKIFRISRLETKLPSEISTENVGTMYSIILYQWSLTIGSLKLLKNKFDLIAFKGNR